MKCSFKSVYPTTGINWYCINSFLNNKLRILAPHNESMFKHDTNITNLQLECDSDVRLISLNVWEYLSGVIYIVVPSSWSLSRRLKCLVFLYQRVGSGMQDKRVNCSIQEYPSSIYEIYDTKWLVVLLLLISLFWSLYISCPYYGINFGGRNLDTPAYNINLLLFFETLSKYT